MFACSVFSVLQGHASLASLRQAKEALIQQRDTDAAEHTALLQRLREHQRRQQLLAEASGLEAGAASATPEPREAASGGGGADSRMLSQLLLRVQRLELRKRGGGGEDGPPQSAAVFEADISARVRLLAAEDRLVFELTKRADLLRSLEEALRRRRAADVEASAVDRPGAAGGSPEREGSATLAATYATDAAARLRVVDEEVENLDMRLGVVERRVSV